MDFNILGVHISYSVVLVLACTAGAVIGSLTQAIVATIPLDGPPVDNTTLKLAPPDIQVLRGMWLFLRLFIGGVLGFVFGLYFVGTLHETPATFAKIWALSVIVGYAAPKLWQIKEAAVVRAAQADADSR